MPCHPRHRLSPAGRFVVYPVRLQPGDNIVSAIALDAAGNVFLGHELDQLGALDTAVVEHRHALRRGAVADHTLAARGHKVTLFERNSWVGGKAAELKAGFEGMPVHHIEDGGAKLSATALYELKRRGGRYAIVTMCIGGGQGAAGLFERV